MLTKLTVGPMRLLARMIQTETHQPDLIIIIVIIIIIITIIIIDITTTTRSTKWSL